MDYSSALVFLVVVVVVGTGYVFLADGLSDLVQIWTKDVTSKTMNIFLFQDFQPKVKGQIHRRVRYFIFAINTERLDGVAIKMHHILTIKGYIKKV